MKEHMILIDCERVLLAEIANPESTRLDVAKTYALALRSGEEVTWAAVNQAILDRWSKHALVWIKTKAWSGEAFKDRAASGGAS